MRPLKIACAVFTFFISGLFPCGAKALEKAILAGGCFWCTQAAFLDVDGVSKVTSGYTGGHVDNPTYQQVSSKKTGHVEGVEVLFDPSIISYSQILDIFWESIDPFDADGQFADKGSQYKTAIFYSNESQKKIAEESLKVIEQKFAGKKVATQILPEKPFYPAEEYHQKYSKKNPTDYNAYKYGSGRVDSLKKIWGNK